MSDDTQNPVRGACTECASPGRRDFLLDALRAGAMALAAVGLSPGGANAMPPRLISAISSRLTDKSYPAPTADGVQIDNDAEVILSRSGKQVYALVLACPHQNTALRWDVSGKRFQCPKHKSRYRPDGTFIEGRATRSMDRYAIRLVGSNVVVDIDKVYQEDLANGQWQQAVVVLP